MVHDALRSLVDHTQYARACFAQRVIENLPVELETRPPPTLAGRSMGGWQSAFVSRKGCSIRRRPMWELLLDRAQKTHADFAEVKSFWN
jgi:hypothetical protein